MLRSLVSLRLLILCAFVLSLAPAMHAQSPAKPTQADSLILQGKEMIHRAVEHWDADGMQKSRAYFERLLENKHREALVRYYLGYCCQQLSIFHRYGPKATERDRDTADKLVEAGVEHLEKAIQLDKNFAEAHALAASLYGDRIASNPLLGMTLGPKSGVFMEKALTLAPDNPRVVYLDALKNNFTPTMFGGSKEEAMSGLLRSARLFAQWKSSDPLAPDWGHPECYAWLGSMYTEQKKFAEARAAFEKALELRPNYGWVTYELLPQLDAAAK
jgi:tetratricopeptide (TPR) repeat protein